MASSSSSSSRTWKYDVFPSFRGEDVRKTFLSHLVKELKSKSINTFIDNGIERSHLIADELLSAIRESRISIVVLSKNYVSSTWCLNELAEIHECFREMNQMVIPVFYELDPSHVKKQTGEFGKTFDETCQGKTEDQKQRWVRALAEIATIAGYDSRNWTDDSKMIEEISKDVLKKLLSTPSDDFRDFVGIGDHIEAIMDSKLCLESGGVRMVGIWGPSGIGKSTIASALFHRLSTQFDHRAFASYKRAIENRKVPDVNVKLAWAQQFLSKILGQKNIKIQSLGMVEQRLKHMKVLIVLDDVDEIELLETLVGQPGWFGFGSRIIVVTQDRALLEKHEIDIVYEVEFPSEDLALQMFCQSAFGQTFPPDGFMELAAEVTNLSGNLPLGLNVLGSSLRKKKKEYWEEMMPRFRNGLNGKIEKTLRVSYDGLDEKDDQDIFLHIACLFNGESVSSIKNLLEKSCYTSVNTSLRTLAEKSLVRITTQDEIVQMHILLEKLGREIVRSESINNPGKRRFLVDLKDISDVFENNSGTKNVLGIRLGTSEINEPLFIDDKSFEGMRNLQFINFFKEWWPPHKTGEVRFCLPHQGLIYFPRKLRLLHWDEYPAKYIPSNFKAEHLVELIMIDSKLEKLWEGAQPFRSLEVMDISGSRDLKEIPDLSNATNLKLLDFSGCTSLVTLPSSIRNLKKLIDLYMSGCSNLEVLPTNVNLECLEYLDLRECSRLRSFPRIARNISRLVLDGTAMEEEDCYWIENLSGLTELQWENCPLRCMPPNFHPEHLVVLQMEGIKLEKLWEGVKLLTNLMWMYLESSENLKEIPDLSKATSLTELILRGCKNLKEIPDLSKATNLQYVDLSECKNLKQIPDLSKATNLVHLDLSECENLEEILDLSKSTSLTELILRGCKNLKQIPDLSKAINLGHLDMSKCETLKEIPNLPKATNLTTLDLSGFENLKEISNLSKATNLEILVLDDCTSLVKLPSSIQHLDKLRTLKMRRCTSLEVLPTYINLVSLTYLDLSGCSRLTSFPQLSTSIEKLDLSNTAIEEVPPWIEDIDGLTGLWMSGCTSLEDLPTNINLESLTYLNFSGCSRLRTFPQLSTSIEKLDLSNTAIEEVPSWIENITGLTILEMRRCTNLEDLPTNINSVSLTSLDFSGCSRLTSFPQLSTSIEKLDLSNTAIEEVPSWIENITGLTELRMRGCTSLEVLPTNINLVSLTSLNLSGCSRLRTFPQISTSIKRLYLSDTAIEEVPSWTENIIWLTELWMTGCKKLKIISTNMWNLKHLHFVDFTDSGGVNCVH